MCLQRVITNINFLAYWDACIHFYRHFKVFFFFFFFAKPSRVPGGCPAGEHAPLGVFALWTLGKLAIMSQSTVATPNYKTAKGTKHLVSLYFGPRIFSAQRGNTDLTMINLNVAFLKDVVVEIRCYWTFAVNPDVPSTWTTAHIQWKATKTWIIVCHKLQYLTRLQNNLLHFSKVPCHRAFFFFL